MRDAAPACSLARALARKPRQRRKTRGEKHKERREEPEQSTGGTTKPTWREHREHQDCECGGSRAALARALRALAGRLELERFVSFSCVFLGAFWLDPGEG